ncbi:hypothetical protein [Bradyrhizobium elkanii]|uniref:hypothetical protein n=1 Tax=Bradyrhizobium elkanii TaxID=29448 RepID=UPI001AE28702|nr:hypothetical protein [Bradyrhizobium elkanii]MBP2427612.1 putative RNA-binding Zn-ribbon protein involved in translation (DUF1610 family) [Bradyrhizobium elkanii]WLA94693.1 hypothetical protein QNJ96_16130 [Bradyrhizobium elkanii]
MTQIVFSCTNCGALYRAVQKPRNLSKSPRSFNCAECNAPVHSWEGQFNYIYWRRFVPAIRDEGVILTKQSEAADALEAFRLLMAFRSIRDRAARLRIVEKAEAMAEHQRDDEAADERRRSLSDSGLH